MSILGKALAHACGVLAAIMEQDFGIVSIRET